MASDATDFYSFKVKNCDGEDYDLGQLKGKYVLIVNIASKCALAKQYEGLSKLHNKYKDHNFTVLGFPCNQFAKQAPGTAKEESEFCINQYGASFPILQKVKVNGAEEHPIFAYLKSQKPGLLGLKMIKWNFEKFLVSPSGEVLARYSPVTTIETISSEIENKYITNEFIAASEAARAKEDKSMELLPPVDV